MIKTDFATTYNIIALIWTNLTKDLITQGFFFVELSNNIIYVSILTSDISLPKNRMLPHSSGRNMTAREFHFLCQQRRFARLR